jgi:hypothetical protein
MKIKLGLIVVALIFIAFSGISQTLMINSNLMPPIEVFAGEDVALVMGNKATLGGSPTALNGYGGYAYLWSPAKGLDDPTKPNPVCTSNATTVFTVTVTDAKNCSAKDEVTVTVSASGIDSWKQNLAFNVFPNPADGKLSIEVDSDGAEPLLLFIINSLGQVVKEFKSATSVSFSKEINTESWSQGYYLVLLNLNGKIHSQRLIIN